MENQIIADKMQELIKINVNEEGEQLVSAKELHEFLGVVKHITQWIKPYTSEGNTYGFVENIDFTRIDGVVNPTNGIPTIDYVLTIGMAKEISMLSKSQKGSEARKYFIECEKKAKAIQQKPMSMEDIMIAQLQNMKMLKEEVEIVKKESAETKEEIKGIREAVTLDPNQWRKDTANLINKIASNLGGFEHIKPVREEAYKLLDSTYGVSLKTRLLNKQKKMALEGIAKYKINKINYLDVIAEDKKLINGYINIVGKLALKYGVKGEN